MRHRGIARGGGDHPGERRCRGSSSIGGEIYRASAVDAGVDESVRTGSGTARTGNKNVIGGRVNFAKELKLLSRNPCPRPGHALLALEPEKARQATARARWQADHDSADSHAITAAGPAQTILDHY